MFAGPDGTKLRRHARGWLRFREADGLLHFAPEAVLSVGVSQEGGRAVVLGLHFRSPPIPNSERTTSTA